eukprot:m.369314 g.369314  ORF g.369314 m.369314 type:complete len:856 (-) comp28120_c0_seq2:9122-11689(-)
MPGTPGRTRPDTTQTSVPMSATVVICKRLIRRPDGKASVCSAAGIQVTVPRSADTTRFCFSAALPRKAPRFRLDKPRRNCTTVEHVRPSGGWSSVFFTTVRPRYRISCGSESPGIGGPRTSAEAASRTGSSSGPSAAAPSSISNGSAAAAASSGALRLDWRGNCRAGAGPAAAAASSTSSPPSFSLVSTLGPTRLRAPPRISSTSSPPEAGLAITSTPPTHPPSSRKVKLPNLDTVFMKNRQFQRQSICIFTQHTHTHTRARGKRSLHECARLVIESIRIDFPANACPVAWLNGRGGGGESGEGRVLAPCCDCDCKGRNAVRSLGIFLESGALSGLTPTPTFGGLRGMMLGTLARLGFCALVVSCVAAPSRVRQEAADVVGANGGGDGGTTAPYEDAGSTAGGSTDTTTATAFATPISTATPSPDTEAATLSAAAPNASTPVPAGSGDDVGIATTAEAVEDGGSPSTTVAATEEAASVDQARSPVEDAAATISGDTGSDTDDFSVTICDMPAECCTHPDCADFNCTEPCPTAIPTAAPSRACNNGTGCQTFLKDGAAAICAIQNVTKIAKIGTHCCGLIGFTFEANCTASAAASTADADSTTAGSSTATTHTTLVTSRASTVTEPAVTTPAVVATRDEETTPQATTEWDGVPADNYDTVDVGDDADDYYNDTTPAAPVIHHTTTVAAAGHTATDSHEPFADDDASTSGASTTATSRAPCVDTKTQCAHFSEAKDVCGLPKPKIRHIAKECCAFHGFTFAINCTGDLLPSSTTPPAPPPAGEDLDAAIVPSGVGETAASEGSSSTLFFLFLIVVAVVGFVYREEIKSYVTRGGGGYTRPQIPNQAYERVPGDDRAE